MALRFDNGFVDSYVTGRIFFRYGSANRNNIFDINDDLCQFEYRSFGKTKSTAKKCQKKCTNALKCVMINRYTKKDKLSWREL